MRRAAIVIAALLCVWAHGEGAFGQTTGAISGVVTDANTGLALAGMQVSLTRGDSDIGAFTTAADGKYSFSGLIPSTLAYRACVLVSYGSSFGQYQSQAWNRKSVIGPTSSCSNSGGDFVPVVGGQTTAGIDFPMLEKGGLGGRLTDAQTGLPIVGGWVWYQDWFDTFPAGRVFTDANGLYSLSHLESGNWWIYATPAGYRPEAYGNVSMPCGTLPCGVPTFVVPGQTITGLDFVLEPGARVAGTVTDSATGAPLANVTVMLLNGDGLTRLSVTTNAQGEYRIPKADSQYDSTNWLSHWIPAGTYYVKTSGSTGHTDELYDNLPCAGTCSVGSGTPLSLVGGVTTSGIDFALTPNGRIRGRVTDAATGAPLSGAWVEVRNAAGQQVNNGWADQDGYYTTGTYGMPTGSYFARATAQHYSGQLYSGVPCDPDCLVSGGTPIQVVAGQVTTGVDFALTERGRIEGRVTNARTGAPMEGVLVTAEKGSSSSDIGSATTDADGRYSIRGLADGNYSVWTNGSTVMPEVYDDIPCPTLSCHGVTGTPVTAALGQVATGIDFVLVEKGRIEGVVTDARTGAPIPNARIILYDSTGASMGNDVRTATDGTYALSAASSTGTYFARAWALGHRGEMYDDLACNPTCAVTSATPLALAPGAVRGGVNFALGPLDSRFHAVPQCRILDTRSTGQILNHAATEGDSRWVHVAGTCGIPESASAVALNVTITGATGHGHLTAFTDRLPVSSTVNFTEGQTRGNSTVLGLDPYGYIRLRPYVISDVGYPQVHAIIDASGYFE